MVMSFSQALHPETDADAASVDEATLQAARRAYATQFAWHVVVDGGSVGLCLDGPVRGVAMRAGFGCEVAGLLWSSEPLGPVLAVPGSAMLLWVFLVAPEEGGGCPAVPPGSQLLSTGQTVPLPPSRSRWGEVRWVKRPDPAARHLPGVRTLFAAVRAAYRPHRW
ncbi:MAG: hypothetical protein HOY78_30860 [Saccharothrix sp.]|nr:hypothetical protein [Saccharothrix sp.]